MKSYLLHLRNRIKKRGKHEGRINTEKIFITEWATKWLPPILPLPLTGTGRKTGGRTERMPKMVATGTRIGIRPSLFSSGCLWFVSWHPHRSVERCYNILTISRSRNVNSPPGYLQITCLISNGRRNRDGRIIHFHCWPTSRCFSFSLLLGSTHTYPFSSPSNFIFSEIQKELLKLWHKL